MDIEDYEETLDLLEDLTEEELNELNDAFDPENNLLPINERINYECRKEPSRFFNKDQLSEHLKSKLNFGRPVTHPKSMAEKIKETEDKIYRDYVPFVKKEQDHSNHTLELPKLKSVPRARAPSPLPDLTDEEITVIENATEDELVEVAAQLKMNDLVTAEQIESISRGDKPLGTGILRPTLVRTQYPQKSFSIDEDDDEEEYIDVDGMVKALRSKGEDVSIIICNNQPYMDPEVLEEIAAHLLANKNIRHLSLANCNFTDGVVESFAEALLNNTKLETLNLESNFITPIGVKKLLDAIQDSKSLREIRLENQYSKIGPKCEAEMAAAMEKNYTMLSFGYSFETRGPRDGMNRYILRNNDILRAARRNGETFYNLAEQKRIIAKFKPPWMMRRPKRRGPESFEGRKIVMRGDSKKKKKKKGPAMMNEMLAKAAQVSKRYEEKQKAGELHSEFQRLEDQSKKKVEREQEGGEQQGQETTDGAKEDEDENVTENGEGNRRRRERGSADAEGMGAMTRRRRRRGEDDEEEDDAASQTKGDTQDQTDGRRGSGKMDAETRRRAMRGGKIVEDEKAPLGAAVRRRRGGGDEEEEGIDFSQFEERPKDEDENEDEASRKSANDDAARKSRVPSGKRIAGQEVASLDSASMKGRRRNRGGEDEAEDLDAILNSVDGDDTGKRRSSRNGSGEPRVEDEMPRRRGRRDGDEGESLDDMLSSVPHIEAMDDGGLEGDDYPDMVDEAGVRIPSGRSIGAQSVARMETASLRGRRRRNLPNEDEEESLDDLLKTVDSKPVAEEASKGKKAGNETEDSGSSRRESVTKLPTGRQIKQQVVEDLTPASFKGRRRNKAYNDEDEDIDTLLSSVKKADDGREGGSRDEENAGGEGDGRLKERGSGRMRMPGRIDNDESFGAARRRKSGKGTEDEGENFHDSKSEGVEEGSDDEDEGGRGGAVDGTGEKRGRLPKGQAIALQETVRLGNVSLKGRRRQVIVDEEEDLDQVLASVAMIDEKDSIKEEAERSADGEKTRETRLPRGERIAAQEQKQLEAASFKDRRRRRFEDEEEGIDSILSQTGSSEDVSTSKAVDRNNSIEKTTASSKSRLPSGTAIAKSETAPLENLSFADRRRRRQQIDDDEPEEAKEEDVANGYEEDIAVDRERRRKRPNDDDNDEDLEKKREMRRKQREATAPKEQKTPNGQAVVEKPPAAAEEKKPEKESPVIIVPERPPIDLTKPMSLRERRRLKEQGLL